MTAVATVIAWRAGYPVFLESSLLIIAGILLVMIVVAEGLSVSSPPAGRTFSASGSAALCFGAGLTLGPVLGALVVALAHIIDGVMARRQAIKTIVNSAGIG